MAVAPCGRCDNRSTTKERFTFQGHTYVLPLCEGCADLLSRDMYMWVRCGTEEIDEAARISEFAKPYTQRPRLASGSDLTALAVSSPPIEESVEEPVEEPFRLAPPDWAWTRHAEWRLAERGPRDGFTREDVLMAVRFGSNWYPADSGERGDKLERRRRGPVIVSFDPETKTIVTVFSPNSKEDQDIDDIVRDHG